MGEGLLLSSGCAPLNREATLCVRSPAHIPGLFSLVEGSSPEGLNSVNG